jgi:predicted dehydrogenase
MNPIPIPQEPVRIAVIGAGNRSRTIYRPLFSTLKPWVQVVAVCDPVKENCDQVAAALGAPAFYDLRALLRARPMEAALVITPVESHHSISVSLSSSGIHNLTETSWASMVCQAKDMIAVASRHSVVARVAENFFRFPVDRFAQALKRSGYLGRIGRVFSYADHTGYHNNSRWIVLAGAHPQWVQCVEHAMPHPAFYSMPQRRHESETLTARFYGFPDGLLVMDTGSGHVKGHLGRQPRPGYTEWQGERGTLVYRAMGHRWGDAHGELRRCSDAMFAPAQEARGELAGGGLADILTPVILEMQDRQWIRIYADTPEGRIEHANPFRLLDQVPHREEWYSVPIVDHVVDFALTVRGLRPGQFTAEDALMSEMMEVGAHESALNQGRRIALPIEGDLEADALTRESLRLKYGVDPLDVEAMLSISYPRP